MHNGGNPDAATPREGRRFSDCKPLFLVTIMTVAKEKAPANYVPAAAVIRRERALSGFTAVSYTHLSQNDEYINNLKSFGIENLRFHKDELLELLIPKCRNEIWRCV